MPNNKSSAIVTTAESTSDPKQPNRFEKKKNILPSQRTKSGSVPPSMFCCFSCATARGERLQRPLCTEPGLGDVKALFQSRYMCSVRECQCSNLIRPGALRYTCLATPLP